MPFTFAHPAASIPLKHPLRRFGVLSALVIGSLSPDIMFFVPMGVIRSQSHSLAGIFWFCLPVGLLSYVTFHIYLKGPFLGLLPEKIFCRLGNYARQYHALPLVSRVAVIVSLLCGATTHIIWDSFTHWDGYAVAILPVLKSQVFSIVGYPVYLLKLLQQASSFCGFALIGFWIWRWWKNAPKNMHPLPVMLSRHQKYFAAAGIGITPLVVGVGFGLAAINAHPNGSVLKIFVENVVVFALPTYLLAVIVYGIVWHVRRQLQNRRV